MNTALNTRLSLPKFNSYGAHVADVFITPGLLKKLDSTFEFCKSVGVTTQLCDNKLNAQFIVDQNGYRLAIEFIEWQGPMFVDESKHGDMKIVASEPMIYSNSKYKGD